MRLIISGASGFLGSALLSKLSQQPSNQVLAIFRTPPKGGTNAAGFATLIGKLEPNEDWSGIPRLCQALIHTAARVHVMKDASANPLGEYRRVNVEGTLNLARQAAAAGLRRFIFLSTLKVNGESTPAGKAYTADDKPAPLDPYSVSKWEAEQGLREIAARSGMEIVIIRPPLIYGPGVKGNFLSMARWLKRGIPLPLGAIRNQRSMLNLDNLLDLIVVCIAHPAAANQTFLASDGEDLSTPDLLRRTGAALGKPARLIPVPVWLLKATAAPLGKAGIVQRLCESLRADISKTRRMLDWSPAASVDEGLRRTAESLLHETHH